MKKNISEEILLHGIEKEIKELSENHARESKSRFEHQKRLNEESIRITQHDIDSMSGYSPAHEKHLAYLKNNAFKCKTKKIC